MPRVRTAPLERTPVLDNAGGRRGPLGKVLAYVALTKPRIIEQLLISTIPTMFVAERGVPGIWLMVATLVGGTLAAGGANAINMYVDRDIDALMERTRNRPLVTGAVTPRAALVFAITIEVLSFVWLTATVNLLSAVLAVSACLFYVFVYTLWLKRTSKQNIVIGGAAGAVPVLVGWASVRNEVSWPPVVLFLVIFIWTPPHTWALALKYKDDYSAASVPMLPSVATFRETSRQILAYSVALVAVTVGFTWVGPMGALYLWTSVVLGAVFLAAAVALHRAGTRGDDVVKPAMRLFTWSITYVSLLFVAMAVDQVV